MGDFGSKIEVHFLKILKKNEFLGDFDWQIEFRFFKIMKKNDFLGDFGLQIEVRFFKILRKKKRTPILHIKSLKVRSSIDFENKGFL